MKQKKSISSPKGQIEVKTQRTSYYSNETIVGWVYLNVKDTGFMAGVVRLRFVGKARSTSPSLFQDQDWIGQLNNKFLNSSVDLHDFGKQLPIGQIVFPFEISLNLFTSSLQISYDDDEIIIEFYIVSEVINQKNKLETQIKFKHPLKIYKSFKQIPIPMYNIFRGDPINCLCCFRKNIYSIIKMNFIKNEFQKFESIKIDVEIDQSNCSQDMNMSIRLIKTLVVQYYSTRFIHTIEIEKFHKLKCEGLQKRAHTVEFKLNYKSLESTQISPVFQLQYFLAVFIRPFRINYKFPITIIEPGNLLMDQQIFNYNQQNSFTGEQFIFDKMARLDVNQQNFLEQKQILQLSMYKNLQIDGNYFHSHYHALQTELQPVFLGMEVPIIAVQQQKKTLQE